MQSPSAETANIATFLFGFFLILGVGYWLKATRRVDPKASDTLNLLITDVTMPGLILSALYGQTLEPGIFQGLVANWVALAACMGLGVAVGSVLRLNRQGVGAMCLCSAYCNTGFLGTPLVIALFAANPSLGNASAAAATAVVIDTFTTSILLYTVGIAMAIRFGGQGVFDRAALKRVITSPMMLSVITVVVINLLKAPLPEWLLGAAKLLGSATVPLVLISLGLRLDFGLFKGRLAAVLGLSVIKLVLSPAIVIGIVLLLDLHGVVGRVAVLQAGMPTAMMSAVIAARYGNDAELGTAAVVLTTALSGLTLPLLLALAVSLGI